MNLANEHNFLPNQSDMHVQYYHIVQNVDGMTDWLCSEV